MSYTASKILPVVHHNDRHYILMGQMKGPKTLDLFGGCVQSDVPNFLWKKYGSSRSKLDVVLAYTATMEFFEEIYHLKPRIDRRFCFVMDTFLYRSMTYDYEYRKGEICRYYVIAVDPSDGIGSIKGKFGRALMRAENRCELKEHDDIEMVPFDELVSGSKKWRFRRHCNSLMIMKNVTRLSMKIAEVYLLPNQRLVKLFD